MNWTLNITGAAQAPSIVSVPPPLCLQEYAVQSALRYSWVLLVFLLALIFYFGRFRPQIEAFAAYIAAARGWDSAMVLRTMDKALLVVVAGLAAVVTQALRTAAG